MAWTPLDQEKCRIAAKGLVSLSDSSPLPPWKEIDMCRAFITMWIGRWERPNVKFNSQRLANAVGIFMGADICKGAFIAAALKDGFKMYECWWSEHDVIFNMDFRKVEKYWREHNIEVPV